MQGFRQRNQLSYCSGVKSSSFHRKKSACFSLDEPIMSAVEIKFSLKSLSVDGLIPSIPPYSSYGSCIRKRSLKTPSPRSDRHIVLKSTETSSSRNVLSL